MKINIDAIRRRMKSNVMWENHTLSLSNITEYLRNLYTIHSMSIPYFRGLGVDLNIIMIAIDRMMKPAKAIITERAKGSGRVLPTNPARGINNGITEVQIIPIPKMSPT